MKYLAFAACERFGLNPALFAAQDVTEQVEMMAYELVRQREERAHGDVK